MSSPYRTRRRSWFTDGWEDLVVELVTPRQVGHQAVAGERGHIAQGCSSLDVLSAVAGHRLADQLRDRATLRLGGLPKALVVGIEYPNRYRFHIDYDIVQVAFG